MKTYERIFIIGIVVFVVILLAFTASNTPVSHAQSDVKATTSPLPTQIPPTGIWHYMGHGAMMQGQCALGSEPQVYHDDMAWSVVCVPTGSEQ